MTPFLTIFVLNLLTSIDNAIVIAGIVKRTHHAPALIGLVSAVLITILRTALIMGVLSVAQIPGFRIVLGIVVLWVALGLTQVIPSRNEKKETSFLRLLVMIVGTDMALSIDNILSLSIVTKNGWLVGIGVLSSLVPLLLLLPMIVRVMERVAWIQILAAGFVAELGLDVITDDGLLIHRMPTGWKEFAIRSFAAMVVMGFGFWHLYRARRRPT